METSQKTQEQLYLKAQKKAREIRSFYYNLMSYCVVIPILIAVNLIYTPEYYWFFFSMFGWGFGLLFHAMGAFDFMPFFGPKWEQRKLNELLEKERQKSNRHKQSQQ